MTQGCGSNVEVRTQLQALPRNKVMERDLCTKFRIHVGHERSAPTGQERFGDARGRRQMAAPEPNTRLRVVHCREERQPTDMIEVRVAEQDIGIHRYVVLGQRGAEFAQSAAGIEYQQMRATTQFDTNGVAAIARRRGPRCGQASSRAPEPQGHSTVMSNRGQGLVSVCHRSESISLAARSCFDAQLCQRVRRAGTAK